MKGRKAGGLSLILLVAVVGLLGAQGGGHIAAPSEAQTTLGAAGGIVNGPDGTVLSVPPDALVANVTLRIARDVTGTTALPVQWGALTPVYAITTNSEPFNLPVSLSIPFDTSRKVVNTKIAMAIARSDGEWELVPATTVNGVAKSTTMNVSHAVVVQMIEAFSSAELLAPLPLPHWSPDVWHVTAPQLLEVKARSRTLPGWENYCATVSHHVRVNRWGRVGRTGWTAKHVLQDMTQTTPAVNGTTTSFMVPVDSTLNGLLEFTFNSNCLELVHPIAGSQGPTLGGFGQVALVYVDIHATLKTAAQQTRPVADHTRLFKG